eukprot:TRINITY_DN3240_c0_g1_i1.p1 TRINITY_DN3240_c0_g1~~TRINITY_DN3240_c0_g1_i1.p1  ORF type:complete len:203 (-),score=-17.08 TRINITY_DN3240_c0_g1_i1:96-704(-)
MHQVRYAQQWVWIQYLVSSHIQYVANLRGFFFSASGIKILQITVYINSLDKGQFAISINWYKHLYACIFPARCRIKVEPICSCGQNFFKQQQQQKQCCTLIVCFLVFKQLNDNDLGLFCRAYQFIMQQQIHHYIVQKDRKFFVQEKSSFTVAPKFDFYSILYVVIVCGKKLKKQIKLVMHKIAVFWIKLALLCLYLITNIIL